MKPKMLITLAVVFALFTIILGLISSFALETELAWFIIYLPSFVYLVAILLPYAVKESKKQEEVKAKNKENEQNDQS